MTFELSIWFFVGCIIGNIIGARHAQYLHEDSMEKYGYAWLTVQICRLRHSKNWSWLTQIFKRDDAFDVLFYDQVTKAIIKYEEGK